jgi:ubiquitin-protein ligase
MLYPDIADSPLEEEVAKQFRDNKSGFNKTAKEWTKKHAKK